MLTDDDLRELIESAASAAPEPAGLDIDGLRAIAPSHRRSYRQPLLAVGAIAAVLAVVALCATSFRGGSSSTKSAATASAPSAPFAVVPNSIGGDAKTAATGAPSAAPGASPGAAGAAAAPQPADSAKVIKNGTLEVRVGKGAVTESMNRLTALATGFGGYISESRTTASSDSGSQASATISVRVPAAAFEQLIAEASKLGEVRSTSTSGQDVTAQFTDIDAQLQALNATREQFLLVLGQANNVGDILAVQDRITQVQTQIDQLEGQKRLLTDQTSFGTLSVTLLEPGATAAAPPVHQDDTGLGDAWREARDHFVDGIESIVAASGTIALVALCGGVLFLAAWLVYRRLRLRTL